jgi:hypothetical protein
MSVRHLPAQAIAAALLLCAHCAAAQTVPPQPTPFQGLGTLAPTPTPTPTPTATPAVVYEKPDVRFTCIKNPGAKGVIFRETFTGGLGRPNVPQPLLASRDTHAAPFTLRGTIQTFHPPAAGYQVQCFFLAKFNGKQLIFGARPYEADGSAAALSFPSPSQANQDLLYALPDTTYKFANSRTSTNVTELTVVKLTGDGPGGQPVITPQPISGWIMRIYVGDQLVCTAASEENFNDTVRNNSSYFDKVFAVFNP